MRLEDTSLPPLPNLPDPLPPSFFPATKKSFPTLELSSLPNEAFLRRPSSAQVLSTFTLAHLFYKRSTDISCFNIRDSRKYPTLSFWGIAMDSWEVKASHTLLYISRPPYVPTSSELVISKIVASISLVLCLSNSTICLGDSSSAFPMFSQLFRSRVH